MNALQAGLLALPYIKDVASLFILAGVLAADIEKENAEAGAVKRAKAIKQLREQLAAPGGIDLPKALDTDFFVGKVLDLTVWALNKVGLLPFLKGLRVG
jgi:hypothetical protein